MSESATDEGRVPCSSCGSMALPATTSRTGGLCMPCFKRRPQETTMDRPSKLDIPPASDDPCWFCGLRSDDSGGLPVMMEFFLEHIDTDQYWGVKLKRTSVWVPRCKKCQSVHDRWRTYCGYGGLIGLLLGLISGPIAAVATYQRGEGWEKAVGILAAQVLVSPFLFGGFGVLIGWLLPRRGVPHRRHGYEHPVVQAMVEKGWSVSNDQDPEK